MNKPDVEEHDLNPSIEPVFVPEVEHAIKLAKQLMDNVPKIVAENQRLQEKVQQLESQIVAKESEIKALTKQIKFINLAGESYTDEEKKALKKRINALIQMIDSYLETEFDATKE